MIKKITLLSLALILFSVSAFASVSNPILLSQETEKEYSMWTDGTSEIESITSGTNVHMANLEAWDGSVSESLQGAGTEDSPYLISNGKELAKFAQIVNGGEASAYAKLTSDIHMGNHDYTVVNWKNFQIGKETAYTGTFDGCGYTIYNLRYQSNAAPYHGLFGTVSGSVKNFTLSNILFTNTAAGSTGHFFGGVCSLLAGGSVENVVVTGEFRNNSDSSKINIFGGIAGRADDVSSITNCYSALNIDLSRGVAPQESVQTNGQSYGVGGILGTAYENASVTITNCGFGGEINAPLNHRVAGIVGNARGTYGTVLTISNCYNTGDITANCQVAGILGWINTPGAFETHAYNTGTIVARNVATPWASGIANNVTRTSSTPGYFYNSADVQVKETEESADAFNGVMAGLLFTKNEATTGYNIRSQKYFVNSAYTYAVPDTSEGAEEGATVLANKNVYGAKDGGRSDGNKYVDSFSTEYIINTLCTTTPGAFVSDVGINGGKAILGWQAENLQLTEHKYEIGENAALEVSLSEPGYFQVEVTAIGTDKPVIVLADEDGEVIETKKAGNIGTTLVMTFNTGDETVVNLATQGRAIVKKNLITQSSGTDMLQLTNNNSKVIRFTAPAENLEAGDTAAVFFMYCAQDGTVKDIYYRPAIVTTGGNVSAKVDLSSIVIKAKDYLKAFVWDGSSYNPDLRTPEILNN